MTDTIVQEVREIRAQLAARFDYDLSRIIDDAMARQAMHGHQATTPKPIDKALHPTTGAASVGEPAAGQ